MSDIEHGKERPFKDRAPETALAAMAMHLSAEAVSDFLVSALSPAIASDRAWNELLKMIVPREEEVARHCVFLKQAARVVDDEVEYEDAPGLTARLEAFASGLNRPGKEGDAFRERFNQTFGSPRWLGWLAKETRDGFSSFASRIAKSVRPAFGGSVRNLMEQQVWIELDGINDNVFLPIRSRQLYHGLVTALSECDRLGIQKDVVRGALLGELAAKEKMHAETSGGSFWREKSPSTMALIEAALIEEDVEGAAPKEKEALGSPGLTRKKPRAL